MSVTISGSGQVVKQVIQTIDTTRTTTTSSSFATGSNGLSVTITPTNASNKILIMVTLAAATDVNNAAGYFTIYRNGSNLASTTNGMGEIYYNPTTSGAKFRGTIAMNYLDNPATTSPVTYQVYMKNNTVGTVIINDDGNLSTITVMEISGA